VHDLLSRLKAWGVDGEPMTLLETNRIWFLMARSGQGKARASVPSAWVGRGGLAVWALWRKLVPRSAPPLFES
jgi:hypothetical protein